MALMSGEHDLPSAAAQRLAFGPAVWGAGVAFGVLCWSVGFYFLPWWAALLMWWWPSVLSGAAIGFVALWLARLFAHLRSGRGDESSAQPSRSPPPD